VPDVDGIVEGDRLAQTEVRLGCAQAVMVDLDQMVVSVISESTSRKGLAGVYQQYAAKDCSRRSRDVLEAGWFVERRLNEVFKLSSQHQKLGSNYNVCTVHKTALVQVGMTSSTVSCIPASGSA
jgi:hypothetical protein